MTPFKSLLLRTQRILHLQISGPASRSYATAVSDCYIPVCGAEVRRAPQNNSEKCKVGAFLAKHFFLDEPTLRAAGLNDNPPDTAMVEFFLQMMNESKTMYCMVPESRELLGVAVCRTLNPLSVYELRTYADRLRRNESRRYVHFLAMVEERANIYKTFNVQTVLQVEILCTAKHYRRRGIAKQLLKGCRTMAKKLDYGVLRFNTSNIWAAKAASKVPDFKPHSKKAVSSYKDGRGVPWLKSELCLPHREIGVYICNLKKDKNKK